MTIYKANFYRLWIDLIKLIPFVATVFLLMWYMIVFQGAGDGVSLYQLYCAIISFGFNMYFITKTGELIEKKIIRYYLEAEPKRYKVLISLYAENLLLYAMALVAAAAFFAVYGLSISFLTMLQFLGMHFLMLTITFILILLLQKTSSVILITLVLLWVLPNLVNYAFANTAFYEWQIFYYLSPDTVVKKGFSGMTQVMSELYLVGCFALSLFFFERAEL